ncbi:MAG: ATP-binding protein [Deltaproteobacteria bacterium]|jgi:predicted kinase|nr:ATP-binding protein [Deltaproteobacteria bacterium]
MKTKIERTIYALTGGNGSGKTTFALKVAKEKGAVFFSLDKTIKDFNQPIKTYEDYMTHFQRALELMSTEAISALREGGSVVFDFGGGISTRPWLKQIAKSSDSRIEIFHLEVPLAERRRRIQLRNKEQQKDIFFFHMSEEEFDRQNKSDPEPPPTETGITVIKVRNV